MSESTLSALLDALPDDEVVGHVHTAGVRGFVAADGTLVTEPLWLVCTRARAWLAAVHGDELRAVASPHARVVRGWVTDTVEVGPWTAPLRRGTRGAAESLIAKWSALAPAGEAIRPELPGAPEHRGREPRGTQLPPALIRDVPVPAPDEDGPTTWLLAAPTRSEQPFDRADGTIGRGPVVVAVSDRHQVLFAEGPDHTWHTAVEHLVYRLRATGVEVTADARTVHGPRKADPELLLAWKLAELPRAARWAYLASARLESGDARDAVRLVSEALGRRLPTAWPLVARVFLALGDPERALVAAHHALAVDPRLNTDAAANGCDPAADRKRLDAAKVDRAFAWALWRDAYEPLEAIPVPAGLPWPPSSPQGLWAAALGAHGRASEALPLAQQQVDLDQLESRAALLTADGHGEAAEAWAVAAVRAHQLGRDHAPTLLDRAIALEPRAEWHAWRAAWAWDQGDRDAAVVHWDDAMDAGLPPDAHPALPADAERTLARLAADEHHAHAEAAWARLTVLEPDDPEGWLEAAARATSPQLAAARQQAWCAHADTLKEPPLPRFPRWLDAARRQAEAGHAELAIADLLDALREDFLRADAYRGAIAVARDHGLDAPIDWWAHVATVLEGGPAEGAPREPDAHLDARELDALHPAGTGWLARVRHQLDEAEPPARSQLVRGLERLDATAHPEVAARIAACVAALGLAVPDVFVFRGDGAYGCSGWPLDPPVVLLGHDHLVDGPRHLEPSGLAFLVAVELVHLAAGHPVLAFDADLVGTSRSLYRAFGSYAATAETVVDVVSLIPGVDQIAKLQTLFSLSRRVFATRSAVDKVGSFADPVLRALGLRGDSEGSTNAGLSRDALAGASLQLRLQADRAALLLTGDLRTAVDAILASSSKPELRQAGGSVADRLEASDEPLRLSALVQFAATLRAAPPDHQAPFP